jgi:hypothetical protein
MAEYIHNTNNIDISKYEDLFKCIFRDLVELPRKLKNYIQDRSKSNNNILSANFNSGEDLIEYMYHHLVKSMINFSNDLAELIKNNHLIIEEYYDYLEIDRIMKMVLKNNINKINILEIELFGKILDAFGKIADIKFNIINEEYNISKDKKFKISDLSDKDKQHYIEEYDKFNSAFFKYKMEFYSKQPTINSNKKTVKKLYCAVQNDLIGE